MAQLTRRDLRILLDVLQESYAILDLDVFPTRAISALRKTVPSDIVTCNEVNPRRRRITTCSDPPGVFDFPGSVEIFRRHIHEHPIIAYYVRTRDGRAFRISDFLTQSQFHRLGLYNELLRRVGVAHQMAVRLSASPPFLMCFTLNRGHCDFSERDRLLVNLLRPHLSQAYRNAETVAPMKRELALLRQGVEELGRGVILLDPDGCVRRMTARARQWLAEYFGAPPGRAKHLPGALHRWVVQQEALLRGADDVPLPRAPLVVERGGRRLVARLLSAVDEHLVVLEEQRTALEPASLEPLGLSRREAEVLALVAGGKTNPEIGTIFGTSPRTVQKHLEHVFRKLGVETRTAAAGLALASIYDR